MSIAASYNTQILWLLGQPSLEDYLAVVRDKTIGGRDIAPAVLADEWRRANDVYFDLEAAEAGVADTAECLPLPAEMEPLAVQLRADPYYRETFDTLPTALCMVELDKLIVSQKHVAKGFTDARAAMLGNAPDAAALFRFCQPLERSDPPVTIRRLASNRYLFSSPSTDLRAHEPKLLTAAQIARIDSFGPVAGALGLLVGFGSNFLTAIRSENRMVLHNGYHRAYTLRALGITHAPCIVETVTRTDELRVAASESVSDRPDFYFRAKRPPILRDFFDPRLVRTLDMRPVETMIEVEFKMKSWSSVEL